MEPLLLLLTGGVALHHLRPALSFLDSTWEGGVGLQSYGQAAGRVEFAPLRGSGVHRGHQGHGGLKLGILRTSEP